MILGKVPEDSKNIQVGTLVGLMVLPGDDWKNVPIPEADKTPVANASTASSPAPSVIKEAPRSQTVSSPPPSSHLVIDNHMLESL